MDAQQTKVEQLFDGNYKFIVPAYQRNYEWGSDNTKQLISDIKQLMDDIFYLKSNNEDKKAKAYTYFIGSIVTFSDGYSQDLVLIDGQQRVTTLCLIMLCMKNMIDSGRFPSQDQSLSIQLQDRLIDKYKSDNNRLKLKPINKDGVSYQNIIFNTNDVSEYKNSNVVRNYKAIEKELTHLFQSGEYNIDSFWESLKKLEFVWIRLEFGKDNPQKIFESLNATGVKLEESDLIRNYVLMNISPDEQDFVYNAYWRKIEENCEGFELTEFLRYFLILQEGKYLNQKEVYKFFKKKYENISKYDLEEILEYSSFFKKIKNGSYDKILETNSFFSLDHIKFGVSLPLQLQIAKKFENGILCKNTAKLCISLLESYFIRRKICGIATNALNKIIPHTVDTLRNYEQDRYLSKLTKELADKNFPSNNQFREHLLTIDLYSQRSICAFFLAKLEYHSSKESVSTVQDIITKKEIQIEHIFPQTPTERWKNDVGNDLLFMEDHKNCLGNLTLSGYNQEASNKPYDYKKQIFEGSKFTFLNGMFSSYEAWNAASYNHRIEALIDKCIEVWSYSEELTSYISNASHDLISIYGSPKGTKPQKLLWGEDEIIVDTWREVLSSSVQKIYDNNPEKFRRYMREGRFNHLVQYENIQMREPYNIEDNLYIERHKSSEHILKDLQNIISEFKEVSTDDILIQLKEAA